MIKNILLYNCFHLGDILFSQPLVRNLCTHNPHFKFTLFIKYCSYLFCEIPNLDIRIFDNNDVLEQQHCSTTYFLVNQETIAINLWIFAIAQNSWDVCNFIEVSLTRMQAQFSSVIQWINEHHNTNIYFPLYELPTLLPILPQNTNISVFHDWLGRFQQQTILYFNYQPMSGQNVPVQDHDAVILALSAMFPRSAIIIPTMSEKLKQILNNNHQNIVDAEKVLDCCRQEPACEHLCKLGQITLLCDYAIIFDIGACYFHVNHEFANSHVNILHVSSNDKFFNRIRSHWEDLPEHRMRFLQAQDQSQVLENIQRIISIGKHNVETSRENK